jgi:hypothetical protein
MMKTYIGHSRFHSETGDWRPVTLLAALSIFLLLLSPLFASDLKPTPFFMDFYGTVEGAKAGDEIMVYCGNGAACGSFIVTKDGEYGFLHVYGDDRTTDVVEGALPNEQLTFKLNGAPLQAYGPVVWLGDGQRQRVDFRR